MADVHQYYTVYHDEDDRSVDSWTGPLALKSIAGRCRCGWRGQRRPDTAESGVQAFNEWWSEHYTPLVRPDPGELLILSNEGGERRHFLAGRPVRTGVIIELLLSGGHWVPVRYEWSSRTDAAPRFYIELGGPWEVVDEHGPETYLLVPLERAVFRWPGTGSEEAGQQPSRAHRDEPDPGPGLPALAGLGIDDGGGSTRIGPLGGPILPDPPGYDPRDTGTFAAVTPPGGSRVFDSHGSPSDPSSSPGGTDRYDLGGASYLAEPAGGYGAERPAASGYGYPSSDYPPGGSGTDGYPSSDYPSHYPSSGYDTGDYPTAGHGGGHYQPAASGYGYPSSDYPSGGSGTDDYPPASYDPGTYPGTGYGDPGYGDPGYGDPGYGDPGYGDPGYGTGGYGGGSSDRDREGYGDRAEAPGSYAGGQYRLDPAGEDEAGIRPDAGDAGQDAPAGYGYGAADAYGEPDPGAAEPPADQTGPGRGLRALSEGLVDPFQGMFGDREGRTLNRRMGKPLPGNWDDR